MLPRRYLSSIHVLYTKHKHYSIFVKDEDLVTFLAADLFLEIALTKHSNGSGCSWVTEGDTYCVKYNAENIKNDFKHLRSEVLKNPMKDLFFKLQAARKRIRIKAKNNKELEKEIKKHQTKIDAIIATTKACETTIDNIKAGKVNCRRR